MFQCNVKRFQKFHFRYNQTNIFLSIFFNLHLQFCPTCLDLILAFEPRNFFGGILLEYDRVPFSGPKNEKLERKISLKVGKRAKILSYLILFTYFLLRSRSGNCGVFNQKTNEKISLISEGQKLGKCLQFFSENSEFNMSLQ